MVVRLTRKDSNVLLLGMPYSTGIPNLISLGLCIDPIPRIKLVDYSLCTKYVKFGRVFETN